MKTPTAKQHACLDAIDSGAASIDVLARLLGITEGCAKLRVDTLLKHEWVVGPRLHLTDQGLDALSLVPGRAMNHIPSIRALLETLPPWLRSRPVDLLVALYLLQARSVAASSRDLAYLLGTTSPNVNQVRARLCASGHAVGGRDWQLTDEGGRLASLLVQYTESVHAT